MWFNRVVFPAPRNPVTCTKEIEWVREARKESHTVRGSSLGLMVHGGKVDFVVSLLTKVTGIFSASGLGMPVN
jgi:hypothetical protein